MLLSDDEAVAVVVGLRVATGHNVAGFEEAAVAALAKLEQVMPSHLRHRVDAVHTSTLPMPGPDGPPVDATVIVLVAQACRGLERLRFDYIDGNGDATERLVEPFRLVHVTAAGTSSPSTPRAGLAKLPPRPHRQRQADRAHGSSAPTSPTPPPWSPRASALHAHDLRR